MKVSEAMTAQVVTATPQTPVSEIARLMSQIDSGVIPVLEGGKVAGMVTDRDIVIRVVAKGGSLETPASQVMTPGAESCREDDNVADAVGKMSAEKIRRLVVLGEDGRLAGIVSLGDISKDYGAKQVGKTLEDISFAPPDQ